MRVLLVEDNHGDRQLIVRSLRRAAPDVQIDAVTDGVEALAHLHARREGGQSESPDIVLLDLKLPKKSGLEVLREIKHDPFLQRIPVFVLSSSDAPSDVNAAYDGHATAVLTKPVADYDEVIGRLIQFVQVMQLAKHDDHNTWPETAPESTDTRERVDTQHLAALVNSSADAILSTDLEGTIRSWNGAAELLYGYTASEAIGRNIRLIVPEERVSELNQLLTAIGEGRVVQQFETERVDREGRAIVVALTVSPVIDEKGALVGKSAIARDVTSQKQAEERFRLAVESSPSAMVMVDSLGKIMLVNAEAERLFGYPRGELVGHPVSILVPARYATEHPQRVGAFLKQPETRAMGAGRELYAIRKDGTEFPVEIGLNPIHTPEGTLVLSAIVDITERKLAEERFRIAVDSSPNGMVMVDANGDIVLVNTETLRMFGYTREEMIGSSIDLLVPRRFRRQHPGHRKVFLERPESRSMGAGRDLHAVRKDGTEFPVEIGINPIETPNGLLVLSAIVDITERKQAEVALARRTQELARSNAELEQFAYVASHDLQEPLRMVASFAKLLEQEYAGALDDTAREYIRFAVDGATRMQRLIRDLLAYARLSTTSPRADMVDLGSVVDNALQNLSIAIHESEAAIAVDPLPNLKGVEHQLTVLFQNLIGNGLKFRRDVAPQIRIRSDRRDHGWKFSVEDNGIGIAPQYLSDVFQVFRRLHSREQYSGTGIGLALCKRIVERHGGKIWLESVEGAGTTVHFYIPEDGFIPQH